MIGLWKIRSEKGRVTGILSLYVLHTLKKSPKSGYEILSEIKLKCGDKWAPSKGTIYPLLTKLKQEGLINVKEVGSRSKNTFEISPKGRKVLSGISKKREKLRERFSHFRNLFSDILGEEKMDIFNLIMKIRESSLKKADKDRVKKALERCLAELEGIK